MRWRALNVADREALNVAARIHGMVLHGILTGGKVKVGYHMKAKPTASDLVAIERGLDGLITGILRRDLGYKLPRRRLLRVDLSSFEHVEDGDESLIVNLDFAKILPFERPSDWLEAAKAIDKKVADLEAAALPATTEARA